MWILGLNGLKELCHETQQTQKETRMDKLKED